MTLPGPNRGYALVSVLWLTVLLTGVTVAYHAQARVEAQLMATALRRAQAEAMAEAGIWLAIRQQTTATAEEGLRRVERAIDVHGTPVRVTLADVSGLINLNGASPQLLAALVGSRTELTEAERTSVVDAIVDWRDSDHTRSPAGAEDPDYAFAGASHGAKDAPFATVDELRLVQGMTALAFRTIAPALTVFGNHARVNPAAAPPAVLAALPRKTGESEDAPSDAYDERFVQRTGESIYAADATATVRGVTVRIAATLRYARGEQHSVQVLAWSDAP